MANLIENKKIHFNYEIVDKYEAGMKLLGFEVKSLKKGQGSLEGSYVIIRGREVWAMNIFISPYQENNTPSGYNPRRDRLLLLSKKEIEALTTREDKKGLTIVPISIYNKGSLLKISIAVVRGKKKYDKRESIKRRETERDVRREFKDR